MGLPDSAPRKYVQSRDIACKGYYREDGLWDIEGHLLDTRNYSYWSRERGERSPGEPVHDMWMRLTVDNNYEVKAVAATIEASPLAICPNIIPSFQQLVGLRIGKGWNKSVRALFGGSLGCTHMVELLGPLASTAIQTISGYLEATTHVKTEDNPEAPKVVNCHALPNY